MQPAKRIKPGCLAYIVDGTPENNVKGESPPREPVRCVEYVGDHGCRYEGEDYTILNAWVVKCTGKTGYVDEKNLLRIDDPDIQREIKNETAISMLSSWEKTGENDE